MRKRTLYIGIASRSYIHKRMLDIAKGRIRPGPTDPQVGFTSWEALARVLSKQNMMLIEILREYEPESVTELANRVGRQKTHV
jgi:predicted transcriptional regulator